MSPKNLIVIALIIYFAFNYLKNVKAQDTFGPVCDDVTVTCVPSATPASGTTTTTTTTTSATTETLVPSDTPFPSPTELPRAGTLDNSYRLLLIATLLIAAGSISHLAYKRL